MDFSVNGVVYEKGKCIKCGLCIQASANKTKKNLGLTFTKRGYDLTVGVPFHKDLKQAIKGYEKECVTVCPTGALSWKDYAEDEQNEGQQI